ncbi:hypothetical protein [Saccharothrix syringae]|uniref:Lipoprotein n=1 Tax=Saccharothrix syringae TaxID=103733 RepID=A0A5Q0H449_SACSY|nr:hypothetical protein [Saccharothrix syringae]QFZ20998.1 hypothetical protein EKG83_29665 [Saccharothrix syringae]
MALPRWLACCALVAATGCLPPSDPCTTCDKGLRDNGYATGATTGMAALGRHFASVDELAGWYSEVWTCDPARLKRVTPHDVRFHLAPGMADAIAEVAVCEDGYGDVLGTLKPGGGADFQAAYQRDLARDPALWYRRSHRLMMGNGFFLFNITFGETASYGLAFLRCDAGAEIVFEREEFPADVPGCFFLREEYGHAEF